MVVDSTRVSYFTASSCWRYKTKPTTTDPDECVKDRCEKVVNEKCAAKRRRDWREHLQRHRDN